MDDRLRHSKDETAAGRAGIEALRAQLGRRPPIPAEPVQQQPAERPLREAADWPANLEAEMAWGAERERLERRVAELEAEASRLRRSLAAVLREAANGVAGVEQSGENLEG